MGDEVEILSMHGMPVRQRFSENGRVAYECPYCHFRVGYDCHSTDVECRLSAYAEIHAHMKAHADRARAQKR